MRFREAAASLASFKGFKRLWVTWCHPTLHSNREVHLEQSRDWGQQLSVIHSLLEMQLTSGMQWLGIPQEHLSHPSTFIFERVLKATDKWTQRIQEAGYGQMLLHPVLQHPTPPQGSCSFKHLGIGFAILFCFCSFETEPCYTVALNVPVVTGLKLLAILLPSASQEFGILTQVSGI